MVEAYFYNIRKRIVRELNNAKNKIQVAVYWFTNHELFNILCKKLEEDISIELIIHNDYINNREKGLNFQRFIELGGKFYFSEINNPMHHKFCIIDNKILINGSYNWTYSAEERNNENILVITKEKKIIQQFSDEFLNIVNHLEIIENIEPLTKYEFEEFNDLNLRNYLINDIIYQARETNDYELLNEAYNISLDKIKVHQIASKLELIKKKQLIHSLGASLYENGFLKVIEKESIIPIIRTAIVRTIDDEQPRASAKICYGESDKADENTKITEITLTGFPPKPAGMAKMKLIFAIDLDGELKVQIYSLDNGEKENVQKNISNILREC